MMAEAEALAFLRAKATTAMRGFFALLRMTGVVGLPQEQRAGEAEELRNDTFY
jgi:hypothetical protein